MSTELAPPAIPSVETPSKEWVDSVLASTPGSTPSKHIPGNFPETPPAKDESKQLEAQPCSDNQSKTAIATVDKSSVGASVVHDPVGKTVGDTIQSIKNTASLYWSPEEHKEDPHVSLPSTELKGAQPSEHSGGVGALPGNVSESSVALLPDEREQINEERLSTSARQRGDTIKPSVLAGNDEPREPEKEENIPPDASPSKNRLGASQPSDISGTDVKSRKELSKIENQEVADQGKAVEVADSGAAGAATGAEEPKTDTEGSKLLSEELGPGKSTSQEDAGGKEEVRTTPTEKLEGGYGGDYHPAQLHPPPPGASAAEYQITIGDSQQAAQDSPTTAGTKGEPVGSEKKPRFITMVKGEMKILAGKMSGDEQKVQEGKKLVHGET